jgi:hypothetical protein
MVEAMVLAADLVLSGAMVSEPDLVLAVAMASMDGTVLLRAVVSVEAMVLSGGMAMVEVSGSGRDGVHGIGALTPTGASRIRIMRCPLS